MPTTGARGQTQPIGRVRIIALVLMAGSWSLALAAAPPEVLLSLAWGGKTTQAGLIHQPEMERIGPVSFCVRGRGAYLLDTVNRRVLYGESGAATRVAVADVVGWGIRADAAGSVFVQEADRIREFPASGKSPRLHIVKDSSGKAPALVEGYGTELVEDERGFLCIRGLDQRMHRVGAAVVNPARAAAPAPKDAVVRHEIARLDGNEVRLLGYDADGKVLVSVPVRLDAGTAGAALFKGTDDAGHVYVEVEVLEGKQVGLEVHRYATSGVRLGVARMPNTYFTTVYKKTEARPDGSVCQMLTTPEGVKILRYSF